MLRSIIGTYDGKNLKLKEKIEVKGAVEVLVTFLNEGGIVLKKNSHLQRLLNRVPIKIAPLKTKNLIEEGRKQF